MGKFIFPGGNSGGHWHFRGGNLIPPPREVWRSPALPEGGIRFPPREVWRSPALPEGGIRFPLGKPGGHRHFPRGELDVFFDSCIFVRVSRVPGAVDALNHISRCEAMADSESEHPLPERDPMTSPTPRPPKNRRCKGRCQTWWHVTPEGRARPQCCFQRGHSCARNTFRKHHCMWGPRTGP